MSRRWQWFWLIFWTAAIVLLCAGGLTWLVAIGYLTVASLGG